MPFGIRLATVVAAVLVLAWWLMGAVVACVVAGAFAMAASGLIAWQIVSPRGQWFVPTVWRGAGTGNALALTFDDGPDPAFTPQVLDLLAAAGAKATFFMVGERVAAHPELVRRVQAAGHQLGSHSHAHAIGFHFLSGNAMAAEIGRGIAAIERISGQAPSAFRPPVGLRVPTLRAALRRLGRPVTCYTLTERGLDAFHRPAEQIVERLLPHLVPGAILTLHDGTGLGGSGERAPTIAALRVVLERMRERGLRSVRLDQLPMA
ncbi:MAG: polysaccharide deacetylase family protein [Planctomycetota bacterium]